MATAGVSIVSAAVEEEDMSACAQAVADAVMHPIADVVRRRLGAVTAAPTQPQPVVAPLMLRPMLLRPTPERRIAALLMVADPTAVANATSR